MSFVIFGDMFSFPEGYAAANRVHSYAKGINELGTKVHVICFSNEYLDPSEGIYQDINYYYPFNQKSRSDKFIVRRWFKFKKYLSTLQLFRRIHKTDPITVINLWTDSVLTFILARILAYFLRSKLILECSEHPLRNYGSGIFMNKLGRFKFITEAKLSYGVLCISRFLCDLYREAGVPENKLLLIPSTVDPSRFDIRLPRPQTEKYIGYFGSLTFKRDNVDLLIRAFSSIQEKFPKLQLVLGGMCSENEKRNFDTLISELDLTPKVKILEYLSRQDIIQYIQNAELLVMVRSNDFESQASFPSKLTEFLATSVPVITVDVGEISDYLHDNANVFMVKPGDQNAIAEKIELVLNNYPSALQIARKGRTLTEEVFNYKYQAKRILEFVHSQ
ncbi:MAG TPA: glycosyltransferase family 4 protein [Bacteroidales bacterium]|nr:glycosyltransferase family 4 protein [Bacteroidales bacterium]